jgi:hypothetical protein
MIRKALGACALLLLGVSSAQSTIIRVDFTVNSSNWSRTPGGPLPFGLTDYPVINGSVDLDDTKTGIDRFVGLDYTVGNHSFTLAEINPQYSWADFSIYYYAWGLTPDFALYFSGMNLLSNSNSALIEQNWNAIACNNCVSSSFRVLPDAPPATPAPEPASWAMMIGGFGAIGTALRRRRAADVQRRPSAV